MASLSERALALFRGDKRVKCLSTLRLKIEVVTNT